MSRKHTEYVMKLQSGELVSYRHIALIQRLKVSLEDARKEFGDSALNTILLRFMEPEA